MSLSPSCCACCANCQGCPTGTARQRNYAVKEIAPNRLYSPKTWLMSFTQPHRTEHATINTDLKGKSIWARKQICFNAFWITHKSWRSVNLHASHGCCSCSNLNRQTIQDDAGWKLLVCDLYECDKGVELMALLTCFISLVVFDANVYHQIG